MSRQLQALKLARILIDDPERWTCYGRAIDQLGERVPIDSPDARAWSLWGAIALAARLIQLSDDEGAELLMCVELHLPAGTSLSTFNHGALHREVLDLLNRAIGNCAAAVPLDDGRACA